MPALLAVAAAIAVAVGGFVAVGGVSTAETACESSTKVRVAAAPEIAPVLETATAALEKDGADAGGPCVDYQVQALAPEKASETLAADPANAPALWVPDSSVWVTRVAQAGATPATLSQSLAKSPVVVVGPDVKTPASWQEVGMNTVAYLDPLTSSASTAALLSAFGEMKVTGASEVEMGSMMVPLAQRYGAQPNKPQTVEEVAQAAQQGAQGVMTEQQLVALQKAGSAAGFTAAVPASGTMVLDYPLAALSPDESVRDAGSRLGEYLAGPHGAALLAEHGFRDAANTPLASGEGLGKGSLNVLPAPDAQAVTNALRQWAVLTVPSRILAVVDVSGSMDFTDGGQARIALAIEAAEGALKLFPDNGQIGLWAFSVGLGGGNRDYKSLVPTRPLQPSQRGAIDKALRKLPRMTNGGTGLYDTTLAAIRTAQDDYDARSINSVVLLTDGANDDPGSLSLDELVNTIQRERDPARPIQVIAIGMGPDADEHALKKIAGATGGRSYVARNPSDISKVFIDAMLAR
ncbi:MAG TPA: substrate-binding domain-containing protein [Nocardioidaceae bacterium]|nr:substrate-binding domain-containing protein [Nocardioidaceae bacterium]